MSEFSEDTSVYKSLLMSLRIDISRVPIELQLLWLFEIAMIQAFLNFMSMGKRIKVNPTSGNYSVNERDCHKAFVIKYSEIVNRLRNYRDDFVHKGWSVATLSYYALQDRKGILDEFAKECLDVQLNWDNKLFR